MASCRMAGNEAKRVVKNWLELPKVLIQNILQRLDVVEIVTSACLVCPLWWNICKDPFMWRNIDMTNISDSYYYLRYIFELDKICIYAVERSCGYLEEIHIEYFANDGLLECIANSARHLRRVNLVSCVHYSNGGFRKFVEALLMLEELDISHSHLTKDNLEAIGRSCPLLKSLKFENGFCEALRYDDEALAIAKTMPELRHLNIFGNLLSNDALHAVLDGCPFLEYLDLRDCNHLYFDESLREKRFEHIKQVLFPSPNYNYIWKNGYNFGYRELRG